MKKLTPASDKIGYTRLKGGLDQESPAFSVDPGALLECLNYVCGSVGGYERIGGYERYSGKAAPSAAVYYYAPCTFAAGGPAVGNTITGAASGSTGVVIVVSADYICFTKRSAPFTADESFTVGGVTKGTFTAAQAINGETTSYLHAVALNIAADAYRADIAKPAGAYPIRGGCVLAGVSYVFVDDATGAYGEIYKATPAGWVNVPLLSQISFTTGVGAIAEGATITQLTSGATARVRRVVLESGSWAGSDAAGRLIIDTIVGTFDATHDLQVSSVTKATASSLATAISITKGGRYEIIVTNFTGSTDTKRAYGCDGVNKGFEFDGTIYVPISTGMTSDIPLHVEEFNLQLFFSFRGSSQNSGPGKPYEWDPIVGAGEIAVGEDVTGYAVEAKTLLILGRERGWQLSGQTIDNFVLDPASPTMGAIPYTIQNIGNTYCQSTSGVVQITRAQEYGNFNFATVTRQIQKRMDQLRDVVVASSVLKGKNQYRLYGSDGYGISITIGIGKNGIEYYPSRFYYPNPVCCTFSGLDTTGKEVVFFGSTNGMVYQAEKGSSFDGEEIEHIMWLPYNHCKSPRMLKTFRSATLEMKSDGYCALSFTAEFSYGDPDIQNHIAETLQLIGQGGHWDLSNWDSFYYDTRVVSVPKLTLEGDGENVSVMLYGKSEIDQGHRIDGLVIVYTPRRLIR